MHEGMEHVVYYTLFFYRSSLIIVVVKLTASTLHFIQVAFF
jgi:hypothetical protein